MIKLYSVATQNFRALESPYPDHGELYCFFFPAEVIADKKIYKEFNENLIKELRKESDKNLLPIYLISDAQRLIPGNDGNNEIKNEEEYIEAITSLRKKYSHANFIFNSCIAVRFLFLPKNEEDLESKEDFLKRSYESDFYVGFSDNIKEYLELNLSIQIFNELRRGSVSSGAHGKHITPFLYSDELDMRSKTKIAYDLRFFLPESKKTSDKPYKGITLRILLIDDKLGSEGDCTSDSDQMKFSCKAGLIKHLMELSFDKEKRDNVCWMTPETVNGTDSSTIEIFQESCVLGCHGCNKFNLTEFNIKKSDESSTETDKAANLTGKIQIYAVKSLKEARDLLASDLLRFDLIMMDYLLDKKGGDSEEREFATDFWSDGAQKYFESPMDDVIKKQYDSIKLNRGPMNRLWIFPITAFNQTFIDDLRNKGVRLIDHYWYLSRGADPINTPYQFLNSLNNFLQLQLRQAIFSMSMLIGFINRSLKQLESIKNADDFQAFMGAEYTVIMQKFGWRPVIYRDKEAGSLFAAYVWDNFYSLEENRELFRLLDLVQKFYQSCAYGEPNDTRNMRNYLVELKVYLIDRQKKIEDKLEPENDAQVNNKIKQLVIGLDKFRQKINLIDK